MPSRNLTAETLDAIAAAGYSVYQNADPHWQTYAYFTDGQNIGYIQEDLGGLRMVTVHIPNRNSGTGFGLSERSDPPVELTREGLARAFMSAPMWASTVDRESVRKWPSLAAFLTNERNKLAQTRLGILHVEHDRKAAFKAEPMLEDFVATALQDLQLSENDEACEEEREANDSGTIYELRGETFDAMAEIVAKFRADCGEHIAAALDLEPGEDGLRYRRGSRSGCHIDESELGSTLWLAVTGTGVTFTDDGDAPALQAMADWARSQRVEGLYFGDDLGVYLA